MSAADTRKYKIRHYISRPNPGARPTDKGAENKGDNIKLCKSDFVISPELTIQTTMRCASNRELRCLNMRGVVDTGAGWNYLIVKSIDYVKQFFNIFNLEFEVTLADTSTTKGEYCVFVNTTIHPVDSSPDITTESPVPVRIIVSETCLKPSLLLGRHFQEHVRLVVEGCSAAHIGDVCVYSNSDKLFRISDLEDSILLCAATDNPSYPSGADLSTVRIHCKNHKKPTDIVEVSFSDSEIEAVVALLDCRVEQGWTDIPGCPEIKCRIRPVSDEDRLDCKMQRYVSEILLPVIDPTGVTLHRNYAVSAYNKYTTEQKLKYEELIDEFISSGFWVHDDGTQRSLPGVNVFMITDPNKKPRLVCDFRPLNALLPKATSESPLITELLSALRVSGNDCVVVIDGRSAFYKNRLFGVLLKLCTALGDFLTPCMAFGLSFGPAGLNASLGGLIESLRDSKLFNPINLMSLFIDDLTLADNLLLNGAESIVTNAKTCVGTMSTVGFDVYNKKFRAIVSPHSREAFEDAQSICNQGITVVKECELLGVAARFEDDCLILDCKRSARLKLVEDFLKNHVDLPTKKQVFSVAGAVSYDPLKLHPFSRSTGDSLRSLFGHAFSKYTWSQKCDVTLLAENQRSAYVDLLNDLRTILKTECDCCHKYPTRVESTSPTVIRLATDASLDGGGFVVTLNECTLLEETWKWSKTQRNYHSNRRADAGY